MTERPHEPGVVRRDRWTRPEDRARYYVQPGEDGHPHERDERGWCKTCHAPPGCSHTRSAPPDPERTAP